MTITYKDSGVDIDKANELVSDIKTLSYKTKTDNVLSGVGGFSAAFTCPKHISNPVFLAATDGIGTKIRLANHLQKFDTIGIDLVAMCVNDIICSGGDPIAFLDYYATGKLDLKVSKELLKGISDGCQQAGCALIGGETAEMPVVYAPGDWDMAGFCVGVVEHNKMITGKDISIGNVLIGIPSSGVHSNGYSLINKILDEKEYLFKTEHLINKLLDELLEPTKIYVGLIQHLLKKTKLLGIANITGGGIIENVPRIIPEDLDMKVDYASIIKNMPFIFKWIKNHGNVSDKEMLRTFNCGIGMVLCVEEVAVDRVLKLLDKRGESGIVIGHITEA